MQLVGGVGGGGGGVPRGRGGRAHTAQAQGGVPGRQAARIQARLARPCGRGRRRHSGRSYHDHPTWHCVGTLTSKYPQSPSSSWHAPCTCVCTPPNTHFQTTATHIHSPTRSHAQPYTPSHAPRPCTHLELVADLVLLDGSCFLSPDAEVPGGEDFDADRRPVVLAQK